MKRATADLVMEAKLAPPAKVLALYLALVAPRWTEVRVETMRQVVGAAERSVQRYLAQLIELGWVEERRGGRGHGARLRFHVPHNPPPVAGQIPDNPPLVAAQAAADNPPSVAAQAPHNPPPVAAQTVPIGGSSGFNPPPVAAQKRAAKQGSGVAVGVGVEVQRQPQLQPQPFSPAENLSPIGEIFSASENGSAPENDFAIAKTPEKTALAEPAFLLPDADRDSVEANEIVAAWFDRTVAAGGGRPSGRECAKQGGPAKRLAAEYGRGEIAAAMIGIERMFQFSKGEPWNVFDLEKNFRKAVQLAQQHPEIASRRRDAEILRDLQRLQERRP